MKARPYHLEKFSPPITRPKSFDELCDRLMALEEIQVGLIGKPSKATKDMEIVTAILREKGVLTNADFERFFKGNTGKGGEDGSTGEKA